MKPSYILPYFLRYLVALWKNFFSQEYGGILYDYARPSLELEQIHKWENDADLLQAVRLIEGEQSSGRDFILVIVVKTGRTRGYFGVYTSQDLLLPAYFPFWPGWVDPVEAYKHMLKYGKKMRGKLGYRNI